MGGSASFGIGKEVVMVKLEDRTASSEGSDEVMGNDWGVEETPMGPQGVLLPRSVYRDHEHSPTTPAQDEPKPFPSPEESFTSPEERAQARFERLSTAFSTTLAIVAQMYRDEDWRYLRKDDGSVYKSLVEVCQVAMGKSAAMARRYVQGARDFYLPLSAVMVEGTRLEITAGDVARLGAAGLDQVVADASGRLEGVSDAEEATEVVSNTLQEARRSSDGNSTEAQREWDGEVGSKEYFEPPESDASGPVSTDPWGADEGDSAPSAPSWSAAGAAPAPSDDLIGPLLEGAPLFRDSEALDALPVAVKRVVRAMLALEDADVAAVTEVLTYENRGIAVHAREAQKTLARILAVADTQPWVLRHLSDD